MTIWRAQVANGLLQTNLLAGRIMLDQWIQGPGIQSLKVFSALAVIQIDYFMQVLMIAVQRVAPTWDDDFNVLANIAIMSDKDGVAQPIGNWATTRG